MALSWRIDQGGGGGNGTANTSREDLWESVAITLRDLGSAPDGTTWSWTLDDQPPDASTTLSGGATATATLSGATRGTYKITYTKNGESSVFVFRVTKDATGVQIDDLLILPAADEREENLHGIPKGWHLLWWRMILVLRSLLTLKADAAIVPLGASAATVNGLIAAATARAISTGRRQTLLFPSGVYEIGAGERWTIASPGLVRLQGSGRGRTIVRASSSPNVSLADDRTNALVEVLGTRRPDVMSTTLTSAAAGGRAYYGGGVRRISVASAGQLAAGGYFHLGGHDFVGDNYGGDAGDAVATHEILQAKTTPSGGTVVLAWPLKEHHSVASPRPGTALVLPYVEGLDPVRQVEIEGISFEAMTHAVAIRIDFALGLSVVGCDFAGFSRSPIDHTGSVDIDIDDNVLAGGNNGGVLCTASHDVTVSNLRSTSTGERYHANGLRRAAVFVEYGATNVHVHDSHFVHLVQGVSFRGGRYCSAIACTFSDLDIRAQAIDSIHIPLRGVAICCGAGEGLYDEYSGPLVIADCGIVNARGSDTAADNINDVFEGAIVCHDTLQMSVSNVRVDIGESMASVLDGEKYVAIGVVTQDVDLSMADVRVSGPQYGFVIRGTGFRRVRLTRCRHDNGPGTGANASVSLLFISDGPGIEVRDFDAQGYVWFGSDYGTQGYAYDPRFYGTFRSDDDLVDLGAGGFVAKNASVANHGEVWALDATAPTGESKVKIPSANGERLVQTFGRKNLSGWPANGYGLYCPPSHVLVNGAIDVGQAIEYAIGSQVAIPAIAGTIGQRAILAATTKKGAGTAIVVGVPTSGPSTGTIVFPGAARGAALSAVLARGDVARLLEGTYEIEATVTATVNGTGIEGAGESRTKLVGSAGWTPLVGAADDPTNAIVRAFGTVGGSDAATLSAVVTPGQTSITVTGSAPVVGAYYFLRSTSAQTGYPGISYGSALVWGEPVRVKTVTGSGPWTVTLYAPLEQHHGSGSGLRTLTPLEGFSVRGVDFVLEGRTFACGLRLEHAIDTVVDVRGAGCSRALVNAAYAKGVRGRIFNRGENNSPFLCESSHRTDIEHDYDAASGLGFSHANGIPRGVYYEAMSMRPRISGVIGRCVGLELKGACIVDFDVIVHGADFADRDARDPDLFVGLSGVKVGAVVMNCSNPASTRSEVPFQWSGRIRCVDCRVPDVNGNGQQGAVLFVDSIKTEGLEIEIWNTGHDPGAAGARLNGIIFYDTHAYDGCKLRRLSTVGVSNAVTLYGGGNRVEIERWEYTAAVGSWNGALAFGFGNNSAGTGSFRCRHMIMTDVPGHFLADHAGTSGVNHDTLRDVVWDRIDILNVGTWDDVRVCLDVGALADYGGQQGDVVEICPPRSCTLANATDTFTLAGHDFPDGTPVYLSGTALPAGYTAGTLLYVRDSDRATTNTTFKLTATPGGSVFNFTGDGTALQIAPSYRATRTPTTTASYDKGARLNGGAFGLGLALPLRHYLTAFGRRKMARLGAVQSQNGDHVRATTAALTATVDNASTDPIGISQGKPGSAAGLVQLV